MDGGAQGGSVRAPSIGDPWATCGPTAPVSDALTDSMLRYGYPAFEHNFGLWYDRRRDAPTRAPNGPERPPLLEQPWAPSEAGTAFDGLPRYDPPPSAWYFQRLREFADSVTERHGADSQVLHVHALLENQAHYAIFRAPGN